MLFDLIYHNRPISGAVLIFGAVFNTAAIAGVRFLWRLLRTVQDTKANKPEDDTPLLIVGAGNAGAWAVNLCKNKNQSFGNPVCLVDDDLTKKGLRVQGVPVRGTISDIPELVRKYHILEMLLPSPPSRVTASARSSTSATLPTAVCGCSAIRRCR